MNIRNKLSYQIIGTGISVVTAALLGLAGVGVTGAIIVQGILSPVPY